MVLCRDGGTNFHHTAVAFFRRWPGRNGFRSELCVQYRCVLRPQRLHSACTCKRNGGVCRVLLSRNRAPGVAVLPARAQLLRIGSIRPRRRACRRLRGIFGHKESAAGSRIGTCGTHMGCVQEQRPGLWPKVSSRPGATGSPDLLRCPRVRNSWGAQDRAAAPFLRTTSRHTLRKPP